MGMDVLITQWYRTRSIYHCLYAAGIRRQRNVHLLGEHLYILRERGVLGEKHFTLHYRIIHPLTGGKKRKKDTRGNVWGRRLLNISPSLFVPTLDSWKACSMSQRRPFLQAVCQKGRGSLEWDGEVTLEREHLSQGNKRKARAKRRNRDGEPRWWTMFSICTHLHEKRQRSGHQFHQLAGEQRGALNLLKIGWAGLGLWWLKSGMCR